jgi:hypothetical protein
MPRYAVLAATVALLTLALASEPAHAQSLEIGGRLGPAITTLAGDSAADSKLGLSIGGFAGYRLSELVRIYGELSLVRKGYSSEEFSIYDAGHGVIEETTRDWATHLDYIELQVPLALVLPTEGWLMPRLYAGPSLALKLGCRWSLTEKKVTYSGGTFRGVVDSESAGVCAYEGIEIKTADIGILLGGGLDIRFADSALTADVRYNLGLTDVDESDATWKNRAFQVLLGYSHYVR